MINFFVFEVTSLISGSSNKCCYSQILSVGAEVGEVKAGKKVSN